MICSLHSISAIISIAVAGLFAFSLWSISQQVIEPTPVSTEIQPRWQSEPLQWQLWICDTSRLHQVATQPLDSPGQPWAYLAGNGTLNSITDSLAWSTTLPLGAAGNDSYIRWLPKSLRKHHGVSAVLKLWGQRQAAGYGSRSVPLVRSTLLSDDTPFHQADAARPLLWDTRWQWLYAAVGSPLAHVAPKNADAMASVPPGTPSAQWLGEVVAFIQSDGMGIPAAPIERSPFSRARLASQVDGLEYVPPVLVNPLPARSTARKWVGSAESLPLAVHIEPASATRLNVLQLYKQVLNNMHQNMGMSVKDTDDLVRALLFTSPMLLAVALCIGGLHMALDIMALAAEVTWLRAARASTTAQISVVSVLVSVVSNAVVLLYLTVEGASIMIRGPVAGTAALQLWKLLRVVCARARVASSETKAGEQDDEDQGAAVAQARAALIPRAEAAATEYVVTLGLPLLLGYISYSLLFQGMCTMCWLVMGACCEGVGVSRVSHVLFHDFAEHVSWLRWGATAAVSVVYSAGFAAMLPQVFINSWLQSTDSMYVSTCQSRCRCPPACPPACQHTSSLSPSHSQGMRPSILSIPKHGD